MARPYPYAPGALTEGAGWVWRRLSAEPDARLHLIPTVIRSRMRSACGRDLAEVYPVGQGVRAHCRVCLERNGGEA